MQGCNDEEDHQESKVVFSLSPSHPLWFLLCYPPNFLVTFSICSMQHGLGWKEMTINIHDLGDPRGQVVFSLTVPYIKSTEKTPQ